MSLKLIAQNIREIVTALEEAPFEVVSEIHNKLCKPPVEATPEAHGEPATANGAEAPKQAQAVS
jgi:hypothetical protein